MLSRRRNFELLRLRAAIACLNHRGTRCYEPVVCLSLLGLLSLATCSVTVLPLLARPASGDAGISIELLNPTPLILPAGVTGLASSEALGGSPVDSMESGSRVNVADFDDLLLGLAPRPR